MARLSRDIPNAWRKHNRRYRSKRPRRRELSNPPPSRRWSISLFGSRASRKDFQVDQTSAFLLRLPVELRIQIYTDVLGGSLFHCLPTPRGVRHLRCSGIFRPGPRCFQSPQATDSYYHANPHNSRVLFSKTNLDFLATCRQIYVEGIDLLYSTNTFDFAHPLTFLWFAQTILPQRLAFITKLQISWFTGNILEPLCRPRHKKSDIWEDSDLASDWDPMWKVVAEDMPGLKDLWVLIRHYYARPDEQAIQERVLAPLLQLRGLKAFRLVVNRSTGFVDEPIEPSPLVKKIEALAILGRDG
ncbi:hypothetical protein BU16DRAFT_189744 [Lophium mytilinum]|uniref:DUF7730 domain-containing protein n=1 Tax=Lophium mytilinum TaxID=390894 RepID=A0A6A6RBC4_9PEZI|nr:hypothetical protein BU16DRAFT_189744 [Lophium mytilinum]